MADKSASGAQGKRTRRAWGKVRRLPSGYYQASYVHEGARYVAPQTFSTKAQADTWLGGQRDEISRGVWKPPRVVQAEMFGQYAPLWLAQRRTRKGQPLRPRTREWYGDVITRGLKSFAETRLSGITAATVRAWHHERTSEKGATQAGGEARVLRAILNTAVKDGLIDTNPVPSELCNTSTGRVFRPPTAEELAALIEAMPPRLRLAVQLAAFGGLRLSEWRALRRADLRRSGDRFVVAVERQALRVGGEWIVGPPKSDDGVRHVHLPAWLTDDVQHHLDNHTGQERDALLFPSGGRGAYIDQVWRRFWDKARTDVGVGREIREHDLRHYYGTALAESGATAVQLKSAMGHASINTSMGYVKATRGAAPEVADLLAPPPGTARQPTQAR